MLKLALALGYASPRRLLEELRPSELGMWAALYAVDPWGEQRADLRAAINSSLLANANRNKKLKTTPFSPRDFMPYLEVTKEERDAELSRSIREGIQQAAASRKERKQ